MKRLLTLAFLFAMPAFAQKAYLPHEVEKAAEPVGGLVYLNQFIASNLRVPPQSASRLLNAKVFIKGIVETDGSISHLEVTKGVDTLCDAEAVRVMGLFKAWRPATLAGKPVRQAVYYPVAFRTSAMATYDSAASTLVEYFDEQFIATTVAANYKYRRTTPIDARGFVRANVSYDELRGQKWRKMVEAPFTKREIKFKPHYFNTKGDSLVAFSITARDANETSHAPEAVFTSDGKILSYSEFERQAGLSLLKEYDANGMVRVQRVYQDSLISQVDWFPNGQIMSQIDIPVIKSGGHGEPWRMNSWSQDGTQWVKNGEGYWKAMGAMPDGAALFEQGRVTGGLNDGKWTGKLADSTLYYEEIYDKGKMLSGYSMVNGQKFTYSQPIINPQFHGGTQEMYKFLASNIVYPFSAARKGIAGRVFLSFVVCEDGSMCEYKVENQVGGGLDEEALRVVKLMTGKWDPGVMRGQKVRVRYNLPVNFQLAGPIYRGR